MESTLRTMSSSTSATTTTTSVDSVSRTAVDALVAKGSAILVAGYNPIPLATTNKNNNGGEEVDSTATYRQVLEKMLVVTSTSSSSLLLLQRRQAPLISAGYAMRVACMARSVQSFVSFHNKSCNNKSTTNNIHIVLLGCGMDVLGLWAALLNSASNTIHVWEVDTPAVAHQKRTALLQWQQPQPPQEGDNNGGGHSILFVSDNQEKVEKDDHEDKDTTTNIVLEGRIIQRKGRENNNGNDNDDEQPYNGNNNNYHLMAADLSDLDSLETSLGQAFKQQQQPCPTLVLIELVLAYLKPDSTDQLLEWCAANLLQKHPASALVAFEAVGQNNTTTATTTSSAAVPSIVQAYQQEYTQQFQAKLRRGQAASSNTNKTTVPNANKESTTPTTQFNNSGAFYPLGASCLAIENRLRRLKGLGEVHVCLAGTAAHWAAKQQQQHSSSSSSSLQMIPPGQLFDEHAALILHLSSYVQVVAFAEATTNAPTSCDEPAAPASHEQFLLQQILCPWYYQGFTSPIIPTTTTIRSSHHPRSNEDDKHTERHMYVTMIQAMDEAAMQQLFATSYQPLADQYPSIRKMLKSALKEFSTSMATSATTGHDASSSSLSLTRGGEKSGIRRSYQNQGGDFFVAVRYSKTPGLAQGETRQVLGAIGIKKWNPATNNKNDNPPDVPTFELTRLFVGESYRGLGVGKALLELAESVVCSKMTTTTSRTLDTGSATRPHRIVATTLSLLEKANRLYEKHGYYLESESSHNELVFKTYVKDVPPS